MSPSSGYEVDPARLIAHAQRFDPLVERATTIAQNLTAGLKAGLKDGNCGGNQAPSDVFESNFSAVHDGLAAETERQVRSLPERLHEFGKSFLLAAHLVQAGEEKAVEAVVDLAKPVSSPESCDG